MIESYDHYMALWRATVVKSIVDPKETVRCLSPHHFEYRPGTAAVDENGHPVRGHKSLATPVSRVRFNHYYTKSEEEFRRKCATPDSRSGRFRAWPDMAGMRWAFSQVKDAGLIEHGAAVREAIAKSADRTPRSRVAEVAGTIEAPSPPSDARRRSRLPCWARPAVATASSFAVATAPLAIRTTEKRAWERFLAFTSHARTKPSFDEEDRQYRLDIAVRMNGLFIAVEAGAPLPLLLGTVFEGQFAEFRPYELTSEKQNEWLSRWASLDEASLRTALMGFLDEEKDADARFALFASMAEHAAATAGLELKHRHVVSCGSLFNFATDPTSLPAIRPAQYERLERRLGYEPPVGSSALEHYVHHRAFASEVREPSRA